MTKILLVEDDKSLREIYGVRLLAEGYDIISAGDGEEALAMAIKDRPALILSDVMMPRISGFDMLDILRNNTDTKDIKVIMMTALSSEDQRARGEALGADRYLVKSQVGIEDVVRTVHEILGDTPSGATTQQQVTSTRPTTPTGVPVPSRPTASPAPVPPVPPSPSIEQLSPQAPATASAPQQQAASTPPAPTTASLPQPTAPFSTQRPANLGDRVIQPLSNPEEDTDEVARRMAAELSANAGSATTPLSEPTADNSSAVPPPPAPPVFPPATPAPEPTNMKVPVAHIDDQLSPAQQLAADEATLAASLKLDDPVSQPQQPAAQATAPQAPSTPANPTNPPTNIPPAAPASTSQPAQRPPAQPAPQQPQSTPTSQS